MPIRFITFEGGEGSGKTTQISRLAQHIRSTGATITTTREPGGTPEAEAIRALLVSGHTDQWSAGAEALLNYAARDAHLRQLIRPVLEAGGIVICDRFMDSTRAYQGYAGGCSMALIDALQSSIVGPTCPDLTFIFDLDPALGLQRARQRGEGIEDRYERKGLEFHQRLRTGFAEIARQNAARCRMIDASAPIEAVTAQVISLYEKACHG